MCRSGSFQIFQSTCHLWHCLVHLFFNLSDHLSLEEILSILLEFFILDSSPIPRASWHSRHTMVTEEIVTCEKCEELPGVAKCSCGGFCERCFTKKHLHLHPTHRPGGTSKTDKAWAWISGAVTTLIDSTSRVTHFEQDQVTKWFGLHIKKVGADRVTRLVETSRFSRLVEDSMHHNENGPRRQFPSIISFVGETGAGKSTLSM
jgi:hypothetical protein